MILIILSMPRKKYTIQDVRKTAENKCGKCLSRKYINFRTKLIFTCSRGHKWEATYASVLKNNTWCPYCFKEDKKNGKKSSKRLTIEEMNTLAKANNGKCLSEKYVNVNTKLLWECSEGHRWWTSPHTIKYQNCWCPICVIEKQKLTIEDMKKIAKNRGGECLSDKYVNAYTKLKWRCSCGYEWESEPYTIKRGCWCPKCGIEKSKQNLVSIK
jgi:hypothetical protein